MYNWADHKDGTLTKGVEYVPMLWGASAAGWSSAAKKALKAGASHLLGMNEPDLDTQSNLSAAQAAKLYKKHLTPFRKDAFLISPAVTNGAAPMGLAWLAAFMQECEDCEITGVALHWYDSATNAAYFEAYLEEAHGKFPKQNIWLTEFAGSGTAAQQQAFLKEVSWPRQLLRGGEALQADPLLGVQVIPWMESKKWIVRYAYFGDFAGTLVDSDGALTALGRTYTDTV